MSHSPTPEAPLNNALINQVLARILQNIQEADTSARPFDLKSDLLLNTADTAIVLDIPEATLTKWRSTGEVRLPFIRIGRGIRYNTADLRIWLQENTHNKMGVNA